MSPKRIPIKAKSAWGKASQWVLRNPLPAFILVTMVSAWAVSTAYEAGKDGQRAAEKANDALAQSAHERTIRSKALGQIQQFACEENNKQDRILATVLAIATQGAEDKQLTEKQTGQLAVFVGLLAELRAQTPCKPLIEAFLEATDTADYKQIRDLLREQEEIERRRARRAAEKAEEAATSR